MTLSFSSDELLAQVDDSELSKLNLFVMSFPRLLVSKSVICSASFRDLPRFYLPFVFTVIYRIGRLAKNLNGEAWEHSSHEWMRGGHRGGRG